MFLILQRLACLLSRPLYCGSDGQEPSRPLYCGSDVQESSRPLYCGSDGKNQAANCTAVLMERIKPPTVLRF